MIENTSPTATPPVVPVVAEPTVVPASPEAKIDIAAETKTA